MTVAEWRNKHRKCKFCKHLQYLTLPPFCIGRNTWCLAKKKIVNDEVSRMFCRVFEMERKDGDGNG